MIKDEHSREQGRTASDKSELGAGGNSKVGTTGHADLGEMEPLTKHEYILRHLISLKPGSKISVRKIARELEVSEGTAYRAIKEAENLGIVATKERTGTVRIEKRERQLDHLTFAEVAEMVNGRVLGGAKGLDKQLQKFVIGAMELDAMVRHIEAQSLLIVGNRYRAHIRALQQGAGVLITGGFDASEEAKKLADELCLPIISCEWDTFTVASTINRAIYDHNIKRKIVLVEDIVSLNSRVISLKANNTLRDMRLLMEETGLRQFPVVDDWNRLIGVITSKDIQGEEDACQVDKLMTRNPITANLQTSAASAAHMMVWEGIDLLPIVDVNRKLIAVLYRQDVMEAIRYTRKQPQGGETIEDQILSEFEEYPRSEGAADVPRDDHPVDDEQYGDGVRRGDGDADDEGCLSCGEGSEEQRSRAGQYHHALPAAGADGEHHRDSPDGLGSDPQIRQGRRGGVHRRSLGSQVDLGRTADRA